MYDRSLPYIEYRTLFVHRSAKGNTITKKIHKFGLVNLYLYMVVIVLFI